MDNKAIKQKMPVMQEVYSIKRPESTMSLIKEVSRSFNAHAFEYEQVAKVQREIGERLFERLQYLKIKPQYVLDLGCGSGLFSSLLKQYYPKATIISFDLAFQMLKQVKQKQGWLKSWPIVNGDMTTLPFAANTFDLVFANQAIHWADDMQDVIAELHRVMQVEGCCMFSTLGPDTFQELRYAWSDVDNHSHTNEFADMHDLGDILLAKQFVDPVVDMEKLTVHYPSVQAMMKSLKAQGVRNVNQSRNKGLTGRNAWVSFQTTIAQYQTASGQLPLTYEVVYGHAWKGVNQKTSKDGETFIPVASLRNISTS